MKKIHNLCLEAKLEDGDLNESLVKSISGEE